MESRPGAAPALSQIARIGLTLLLTGLLLLLAAAGTACSGRSKAQKLHDQAVLLFKHGSYYKAIEKLEEALQVQPERADSTHLLADAYLKTGKPELAMQHARKALEIDPDADQAYLVLGQAYLAQALEKAEPDETGNARLSQTELDEAARIADELRQRKPDSVEGLLLQARIDFLNDRLDSAARLYEKALELRADDATGRLGLIEVQMAREEYAEAEKQARALVEGQEIPDLRALAFLARALANQNRHGEAYALLQPHVGADNKEPDLNLYLTAGEVLLMQFDALRTTEEGEAAGTELGPAQGNEAAWEEAVQRLADLGTAMKGIYPNRPESFLFRGISYQLQGEMDLAVEQMGRAVEMAPGSKRYRMALSAAQMLAGEHEAARREMRTLLKFAPGDLDARIRIAQTYLAEADFEQAREMLEPLAEEAPQNARINAMLAEAMLLSGDRQTVEQALNAIDEAGVEQSIKPGAREFLLAQTAMREGVDLQGQGRIEQGAERFREAEELFAASLEIDPANPMAHLRLGELAERRGDILGALEHARAAAELNTAYRPYEARLYMQLGQYDAADRIYESMQDDAEDPVTWLLARAEVAERKGDTSSALGQYDKILREHPDDSRAYLQKATLLVNQSKPEEAARVLREGLERFPDQVGMRLGMARVYVQQDELDQAAAQLRELIDLINKRIAAEKAQGRSQEELAVAHQALVPVRAELAIVQLLQDQVRNAAGTLDQIGKEFMTGDVRQLRAIVDLYEGEPRAAVERLGEVDPASASVVVKALAQAAAGNAGAARESLAGQQVLTRDATELMRRMVTERTAEELSRVAPVLALTIHLGQQPFFHKVALALTEDALGMLPDDPFILSRQGEIHLAMGDVAQARAVYERLWRAAPDFTPALTAQVETLQMQARQATARKNADEAQSLLRHSRELLEQHLAEKPEDAVALEKLALVQQEQDELEESVETYRQVIRLDQDNWTAYNNLAWNLARLGQLEEAARMGGEALKRQPENGGILDTVGWIELQRGNLERATELLRRAARQIPNNAEIRFHLAQALARQDRKEEAARLLELILIAAPGYEKAGEVRSLLAEVAPEAGAARGTN
ncbi:MAG TPA: tetratricopeptide repeat protein [Candidatus Sumerlaeota bacterium]|nr:tetratricopeptide repeat protein [Candidatus Sumerlaeota bacterium]